MATYEEEIEEMRKKWKEMEAVAIAEAKAEGEISFEEFSDIDHRISQKYEEIEARREEESVESLQRALEKHIERRKKNTQ